MFQADLFGSGLPSTSPVSFVFKPKELASVPQDIEEMPEATETEKIAKAKAVLAWLMVNFGASDFPVDEEVESRYPDKSPFGVSGGRSPFLGQLHCWMLAGQQQE